MNGPCADLAAHDHGKVDERASHATTDRRCSLQRQEAAALLLGSQVLASPAIDGFDDALQGHP